MGEDKSFALQALALCYYHPNPTWRDVLAIRPRPNVNSYIDHAALTACFTKLATCLGQRDLRVADEWFKNGGV